MKKFTKKEQEKIDENVYLIIDSILEDDIDEKSDARDMNLRHLAHLRHRAHVGRLDDCKDLNDTLASLGFDFEIDEVEYVHNIINPILLDIDRYSASSGFGTEYGSDGIKAFNSNF